MKTPIAPLSELCDMDRQGLRPDDPKALELPFVGVENVDAGTGILNYDTNSRVGSQRSMAFRFDERHVLYAKLRPYLNKVATPGFAGKCSTELVPLLPREGVDRDFVAHLLRRTQTVEYVMATVTGSRMPRTDMKALMTMRVPLPPLDEQRRIVGILNRTDKIEPLRARAAERLRKFIPALFVQMFGDPAENPMGWETACLGKVGTIIGGGTPRRNNAAYFGGSIPWATPTDITALSGISIESTKETITEAGLRASSARLVPTGAVLLTSRATIGDTAIAALPMATNQGFANFICGECVLPEYLSIWLRLQRNYLLQLAGGTTFKEISKSALKKIAVPIPLLDEQRRFATLTRKALGVSERCRNAAASALTASLTSRLLGTACPTSWTASGETT